MTDPNLRAARIQLDGLEAEPMTATNRQKATMIETDEHPAASDQEGLRPETAGGMKVSGFDAVITYVLAAVGLWISYTALADLALRAGLGHWQAAAWPLIVDGLILVATRSVFTFGDHPERRYAWGLLFAAAAVSIAGNAAHILLPAGPVHPFIALGVGVVPPVMTLAVTHLVMVRARVRREQNAAAAAAPVAQPAPPAAADVASVVASPLAVASVVAEPVAEPIADVAPVAEHVASVAPGYDAVADVASVVAEPVADVASVVAEPVADVADAATVTVDDATLAADDESERTVEELLAFIDQCPELTENVRETARLKISAPTMSFAAIAAKTGTPHASTALRRYQRAESEALAAGFTVPPLPDLDDPDTTTDVEAEDAHALTRELVNH